MLTIYHNSRCSKSREGLCILQAQKEPFEVINYLENVPTKAELKELLEKLQIPAIELVRKKETLWIQNYKNKTLTEDEIITILTEFPKLIERPIVVNGTKAVIGRPPERIAEIL